MTDDQTPEDQTAEDAAPITPADRITLLVLKSADQSADLASALDSPDRQEYGDLLRRVELAEARLQTRAAIEQAAALVRIADALEAKGAIESVTHVTINEVHVDDAAAAAALPPVVTDQEPDEQPARIEPQPEEAPPAEPVAIEPHDADPEQTAVDEPADVAARAGAEERLAAEHEAAVQAEIDATTPSDAATPDVPKKRTRKPSA